MNTERPQHVRIIDEELASRCATIREQTGCEGAFGFAYDVALKARARVASLEMESDAKDAALAQKDATIKALSEALTKARERYSTREQRSQEYAEVLSALHLAGVLK